MPPDVLFDLTPLDSRQRYRGIGRYVARLGRALSDRVGDPELRLSLAGLTSLSRPPSTDLAYEGDPNHRTPPLGQMLYRVRRRLSLGAAVAASGARLFHHTDPSATPLFGSTPTVVTCYDLIPTLMHRDYGMNWPGKRAFRARRDQRRYRSAIRVLAISGATRDDLVQHVGVHPASIDVTPLGVDHARFHLRAADGEVDRVRAALGVDRPFLLYVGGYDARKNLPHLVRAYARSGVADDVALVIAGGLGAGRAVLEGVAAHEGVAGQVSLPGFVPDDLVPAGYRAALAHVFPSLYEGFGLPVLEAMACGTPTITTQHASLAEVAQGAVSSVSGHDIDETASAITRIVSDGEARGRLRELGLVRASSFTWEACAAETLAAYARALDELPPR